MGLSGNMTLMPDFSSFSDTYIVLNGSGFMDEYVAYIFHSNNYKYLS